MIILLEHFSPPGAEAHAKKSQTKTLRFFPEGEVLEPTSRVMQPSLLFVKCAPVERRQNTPAKTLTQRRKARSPAAAGPNPAPLRLARENFLSSDQASRKLSDLFYEVSRTNEALHLSNDRRANHHRVRIPLYILDLLRARNTKPHRDRKL